MVILGVINSYIRMEIFIMIMIMKIMLKIKIKETLKILKNNVYVNDHDRVFNFWYQ